jgi:hypothetical protein
MKVWPLLLAAEVLIMTLHGHELHAEQFLHRITGYAPLSTAGNINCGFVAISMAI